MVVQRPAPHQSKPALETVFSTSSNTRWKDETGPEQKIQVVNAISKQNPVCIKQGNKGGRGGGRIQADTSFVVCVFARGCGTCISKNKNK